MSEMIERMAAAAFEGRHKSKWSDAHDAQRNMYRDDMRAAIKAMRKPTEAMISAADGEYRDDDRKALIGEWQTMIDEALQ